MAEKTDAHLQVGLDLCSTAFPGESYVADHEAGWILGKVSNDNRKGIFLSFRRAILNVPKAKGSATVVSLPNCVRLLEWFCNTLENHKEYLSKEDKDKLVLVAEKLCRGLRS